jgi:PTH1 family peptidyl-tRNA hydrolase
MAVEELARRWRVPLKRDARARALAAQRGSTGLVIPQTYMNLSGGAVQSLRDRRRLEAADIWIVYDDMDLPAGRLRIRLHGGAGGHNGVRSIIAALGTQNFPRFRIGVGRPDGESIDHVLSRPRGEEREILRDAISRAADAIEVALSEGLESAMNRFNVADGSPGGED